MKKAELEKENKVLKDALAKCLPVVEEAYWDHSSAGMFPGSGYNHRCYSKLPFNWRETEEFSKWSKKLKKLLDAR